MSNEWYCKGCNQDVEGPECGCGIKVYDLVPPRKSTQQGKKRGPGRPRKATPTKKVKTNDDSAKETTTTDVKLFLAIIFL